MQLEFYLMLLRKHHWWSEHVLIATKYVSHLFTLNHKYLCITNRQISLNKSMVTLHSSQRSSQQTRIGFLAMIWRPNCNHPNKRVHSVKTQEGKTSQKCNKEYVNCFFYVYVKGVGQQEFIPIYTINVDLYYNVVRQQYKDVCCKRYIIVVHHDITAFTLQAFLMTTTMTVILHHLPYFSDLTPYDIFFCSWKWNWSLKGSISTLS